MNKNTENPVNDASWDKIFPKSDKVEHKKVSFKNRYGITLIGDLYFPKNTENKKLAALAVLQWVWSCKRTSLWILRVNNCRKRFCNLSFRPFLYGRKQWRTAQCSIARYQYRRFFGSGRLLRHSTLCR